MKYYNLMNISLSQLVVFHSAATLKNFTKTADQLAITQPTVSKSISSLEQELGVSLFKRSRNHRLQLTPAGEILYEYCCQLIPDLYQIFNRIQIVSSSCADIVNLRIGANVDARNDDYLLPILKKFAREQGCFPSENIELLVRLMSCTDLFHSVRDGKLDAAVVCSQEVHANNMDGLCFEELIVVPMVVYVPSSNPLFYSDELSFLESARQPLILLQNGRKHNTQTDNIIHLLTQYGILPDVGIYVNHAESIGFNLGLGKGVFIADEFFNLPYNPEVRAFYLKDIDPSGLSIIYRKENLSPGLTKFLSVARQYFAEEYRCSFHIHG